MKKSSFLKYLLILIIVLTQNVKAQESLELNEEKWEQLSKDHRVTKFLEEEAGKKPKEEEKEDKKETKDQDFEYHDSKPFNISKGLTYIILALVAGAIIFLIIKIFIGSKSNKTLNLRDLSLDEIEEQIEHIQKDEMVILFEELESKKAFKKALRLLFLIILKNLFEKEILKHHIKKTNNDYLNELGTIDFAKDFETSKNKFERVWYSNLPYSEESFLKDKKQLEQTIESING